MPTLRRSLSRDRRSPVLAARAKRVRYLTDGDARDQLRQLIRIARALRMLSRKRHHAIATED